METIKPTYVTFEQAKLLKEEGFDEKTQTIFQYSADWNKVETNPKYYVDGCSQCSRPEQWQVVEWLRVNHNIWIYVFRSKEGYFYNIVTGKNDPVFETPQEAYSAAFDYVLNNLI
jgi:hypothetical protein